MTRPSWLIFAAVAIAVIAVVSIVVISRAPVPERQGTAPSVITNTTGAEAQPVGTPGAQPPREVDSNVGSGRAARGSGVEGVPSGGVTIDAPTSR